MALQWERPFPLSATCASLEWVRLTRIWVREFGSLYGSSVISALEGVVVPSPNPLEVAIREGDICLLTCAVLINFPGQLLIGLRTGGMGAQLGRNLSSRGPLQQHSRLRRPVGAVPVAGAAAGGGGAPAASVQASVGRKES